MSLPENPMGYREIEAGLRRQHQNERRVGFEAHNRKPQASPIRTLRNRSIRHKWNEWMKEAAEDWNLRTIRAIK